MAKKIYKPKNKQRIHGKRKKKFLLRRYLLLTVLLISLLSTGFFLKDKVSHYYTTYIKKNKSPHLKNSDFESKRINRIIEENLDNTFGIDISHYQKKEDINWDSLSIGNGAVSIRFVILRATMGKKNADKHFSEFWQQAKKHSFIRGAYHFYRPDEDPVTQANNFLENVKLEQGDLPPILDIEKIPRKISHEHLIENLKIWSKIIEKAYGKKPIIYTYYHYYKDYLKDEFNNDNIWLANYNDVSTPSPEDPWIFWQFTEKGIVNGINTKVDINIYKGNYWSLKMMTLD